MQTDNYKKVLKPVCLEDIVEKEKKTAGQIIRKCFAVLNDEERLQKATPGQLIDMIQNLLALYEEQNGQDGGETGVVLLPQVTDLSEKQS